MYKNTQVLATSTLNSIPSVLPNSTATLKIGKYGGIATRYYQGDIGEILIYNSELAPLQKSIVESYLRYKYAPPVSLGPDTLTNQNTVCTNITLRAQSKYQTYLWSDGSFASSLNVTQPGEYWVTVTDFLGNISSDTINVYSIVVPAPTFTGICVNEAAVWNADMGAGFTYQWSTGPTTPSLSITAAGVYNVTVSDAFGCSISSGNYTINEDTYSQTAFLGNDTTLCANNLIALQNGAAETVSYIWPTVTPTDQTSYTVVTTGDYWVETTNVNGCVARDTITVTVSGVAPIADFSFIGQCQNANVAFTDGSAPIGADLIASWSWDMGEGTLLSTQNPGHVYTSPGIYTVELYVESIGGCGAFHTETVTVFAAPIANFSFTGYCAEYAIPFTNLSVNGSAPITDYFWDFDMPWTGTYNNSIVSAPNRNFPTAATYLVSLQVTDANGCVSDTVLPVLIDPTPIVDFSYNPACENSAIQFTNLSTSESSSTISWNFGDNTYSILTNPSKSFQDFGLQLVTLQVTNPNGCMGEKQHQVEVFPNPVALLDHGPSCKGSYVSLDNVSTIPAGYIDSSIWII
jgi:PKD repeat protein